MKTTAVDKTHRSIALRGRKTTAKGNTSFADHLETGTTANSQQTPCVTSVLIEGLIGLQEHDDDSSDGMQRQALQRGESILGHLDLIRQDILMGRIPVQRLRQLTQFLRDGPKLQLEPRLKEIVEEIELRARIEMAKLGEDI